MFSQSGRERGFSLSPPVKLHHLATASLGKQSRKHQPLIPEFHHFVKASATSPLPKGSKVLAPHLGGEIREEQKQVNGDKLEEQKQVDGDKFDKIGFYHTPKQFFEPGHQDLAPNGLHRTIWRR